MMMETGQVLDAASAPVPAIPISLSLLCHQAIVFHIPPNEVLPKALHLPSKQDPLLCMYFHVEGCSTCTSFVLAPYHAGIVVIPL